MLTDFSELSDAELVDHATDGDKSAFGELYVRYLDKIYRYIYYRVGDHEETEDLTEVVFLKAWETMPRSRRAKVKNFRAWIYRVSHNLVVDWYRTRKQHVPLENINPPSVTVPHPERMIHNEEESQRLAQAISQLKPEYQQVIACRFVSQLSHAETADIMGLKEGHVRVIQHRALEKLGEFLQKEDL